MLIYIFGIIIALLLVSLYLTRNYARKRDASAKLAWGIIETANEKVAEFKKELQMAGSSSGSSEENVVGGGTCAGSSCPCKKGGPCSSIPEHKTETLSNGDVVHMCPKCGEKMYTLKNGEPLNFLEHQCGCGHWGWLHL